MIKRVAAALVLGVVGLGTGAGGAWALLQYAPQLLPGADGEGEAAQAGGPTEFLPPVEVLAPLVLADGGLAGYERFEVQLEVPSGSAEEIAAQLPLLLDAVNLVTYREPLASGPDGLLPEIAAFRAVVMKAAGGVFGKDAVRSVAVTRAEPG